MNNCNLTLPSYFMVSFDTNNLFINGPREETIPLTRDLVNNDNEFDQNEINHIISVLKLYSSQQYRHPSGLAMGNPLSPLN